MSNGNHAGLPNGANHVPAAIERDAAFEPIAVIGFAHKLPQDVTSADSLWSLLMERRTTMTEVPKNRWNVNGFYRSHGNRPSTVKNRGGHFITDDAGRFDAPFFSITPAEAECMDPQQRFLLETSYHALENAGIPMDAAMGSSTSVHVGCLLQEYSQISQRDAMPGTYQIIGSSGLAMLANRVSWFYDLKGPSMTIDTACSGSLVALHLACQELNSGSVNMALACGSNLCLLPDSCSLLSQLNMMSPDGVCHSFDERANGYAKSEGFGVLVLKRLSQAVQDGDTIRAVIRATGCNSDGRTPSITSPSQQAQERLIRETYRRGGLSLDETRFFEAHGTGTPVGDPCEASTISNVFSTRTRTDPIYVGALKSNLGHSEGASGVAGVIKTILALERGIIPPNVYPERVNPKIASACPNLSFPLTAIEWPTSGVRRASVNAFGYGGTNAHAVIDDALSFLEAKGLKARHHTRRLGSPLLAQRSLTNGKSNGILRRDSMIEDGDCGAVSTKLEEPVYKILTLSAFDESALHRSIASHANWLQSHISLGNSAASLSDVAHTLTRNRTSFPWKSFCVAGAGSVSDNVWSAPVRTKQHHSLCFVFTGQGAQWYGMGRELMKYNTFRVSMTEADHFFSSCGSGWSMLDELYHKSKDDTLIDSPDLSQPLCTALQIAMIELLRSWNVRPSTVVGHSSGEIAAAYASGAISRESAWTIAFLRGLAVVITRDILQSAGAMVAVQATPEALRPILEQQNATYPADRISIACYNSPSNLTISGSREAIELLSINLKKQGFTHRIMKMDVAYHSYHMRSVATVYERLLRDICPGARRDDQPQFVSTVTGKSQDDAAVLQTPAYWIENLVSPVQFSSAMTKALTGGNADFLVEIGPHSTLSSPIRDLLSANSRSVKSDYSSVIQRDRSADLATMECAGRLFALGYPIDIGKVNNEVSSNPKMLTDLPSYPFSDKMRYWLEGRTSKQYRFREHLSHELLGTRTDDWNPHEARWINRIVLDQSSYLLDHQINGSVLLPAAGMLVMAIEAVRQFYGPQQPVRGYKMKDVMFLNGITISSDSNGTEVQLTLRPAQTSRTSSNSEQHIISWDEFSIFTYESAGWTLCCSGAIAVDYTPEDDACREAQREKDAHKTALNSCQANVDSSDIYNAFDKAGLVYGPRFRAIEEVREVRGSEATGIVNLHHWKLSDQDTPTDPHLIHPAALDAILQTSFPAYSIHAKNAAATTLPTGFRSLWISADLASVLPDSKVSVHAKVAGRGFRNKMFAITAALVDTDEICFSGEMETTTIGRTSPTTDTDEITSKTLYKIELKPDIDLLPRKTILVEPRMNRKPLMAKEKTVFCRLMMRDVLSQLPEDLNNLSCHLQEHINWMKAEFKEHPDEPHTSMDSLYEQLEGTDTEGRLLITTARSLYATLTAEPDALVPILAGDELYQVHSELCLDKRLLQPTIEHLDIFAHKYPSMRVLEIGSGLGSITSSVLSALKNRFSEYVYTDPSSIFFAKAEERFGTSKMAYKVLDPREDAAAQGFETESFDLVIATHSLTQDTLLKYRNLLRPQGRIVLITTCDKSLTERFIFGLLPNSSHVDDGEKTFLTRDEIDRMLVESGFSGMDLSVQTQRNGHDDIPPQVVISTAISLPTDLSSTIHVIWDDTCSLQGDLLARVQKTMSSQYDTAVTTVPWTAIADYDLKDTTCIFLRSLSTQHLTTMYQDTLEKLKHLISSSSTLIWVSSNTHDRTHSPTESLVPGLVRTLATEAEDNRLVSLSLDTHNGPQAMASHIVRVARTFLQPRAVYEDEYVEVGGILQIPRVVDDKAMASHVTPVEQSTRIITKRWDELENPHLSIRAAGHLGTLYFEQSPLDERELAGDEVLVDIKATGLGNRDLLVAMGQVHDEVFGNDIAGVVRKVGDTNEHGFQVGDRVFGVARDGIAQVARCKAFQLQKIPNDMGFVEAATYPAAYSTAYHSLVNCARIRKGDTILIHEGIGRLGQAAIQIAQLHECCVIVTVESSNEIVYMHNACGIAESHILSSHSSNLRQSINSLTKGRGVDIILTSSCSSPTDSPWSCLAPFGRYISIKENDAFTSPVNASKSQTTYEPPTHGNSICVNVDFQDLMQHDIFAGTLRDVTNLIETKRLPQSPPAQVFTQSKVEAAFRALQDTENTSSVVIEMASDEMVEMELAPITKSLFDPKATYLVAGAFGGIGESVSRWMVRNGAKHLILPSRSLVEGTTSHRDLFVRDLRATGAIVKVPVCDIANRAQLECTLEDLNEQMPPIKGCIQAAMVLQDSSFSNMTAEKWNEVLAPKVAGSWNLHDLLPEDLDFFVMMSSSTGIMGSFGQSNYTAGNTYQDALAAHRVKHGQRAVALAFSMVVGVGYVAQNAQVQALLRVRGMLEEVTLDDIYNLLRFCCDPERVDAAQVGPQIITSLTLPADLRAMNIVAPLGSTRPFYSYLDTLPSHYDASAQKNDKEMKKLPSFLLPAATTLAGAVSIITEAIQEQLSSLLVVSKDEINIKNAVHKYGVDSLVAVEMKNWFAKGVGADVSTTEILGDVSISLLAERVAVRSRFVMEELKQ
ncbi:hypothetical protein NX059_002455 [Plenodomus lindquistii]|nr:hypothetical protein NX059_002455 [Plenodomus lindquistii]